jgi:hypothetical protein
MSQIMDRLYIIDDNRQKYHSSSYLLISDKKKAKIKHALLQHNPFPQATDWPL